MSTAATRTLVVYDFDWSFVDQDTDRWVFEVLSTKLRRLLQDRKSGGSQCMPDTVWVDVPSIKSSWRRLHLWSWQTAPR